MIYQHLIVMLDKMFGIIMSDANPRNQRDICGNLNPPKLGGPQRNFMRSNN